MQDTRIQLLWQLDPEWGHAAWRTSPDRIERVLHVHLGTPEEPQTSLCRALGSLAGAQGYRRVDWTTLPPAQLHRAIVEASVTLRPTLVFMQLQRPGIVSPGTLAEIRRAAATDDLVIVSWCGDVGGTNGPFRSRGDQWAHDLSHQCDLMLYTSLSQARAHRSRGMHNAAYLQIGYDEDRYFEGPDSEHGSRFDVVFLGANYDDREWTSLPGHEAGLRRAVMEAMRKELGGRLGLFGRAWGKGVTHLPPAQSGDVYRGSRLALNISICSFLERYSSDRLLRALACGTPVLMKAFDDWGSLGLVHGENVLVWDTVDDVLGLVRTWLDPARQGELRVIGRRGATLVREHHSWGVRMQELYPLVAAARSAQPKVTRPW
jgi:glycosyl transferase family 1